MTIAVAIKTGSAVVFAADSKLTTVGIIGLKKGGKPRVEEQTYDNATKVVHSADSRLIAMVAGSANIGQVAATDYVQVRGFGTFGDSQAQDQAIAGLVAAMDAERSRYWSTTQMAPNDWPGPTLLFGTLGPNYEGVRVWRCQMSGQTAQTAEILQSPGVRLEGAYDEVFGLLYGFEPETLNGFKKQLRIRKARLAAVHQNPKFLRPVDKINFWAMPLQDAIDMAFFLANVQVQMDRFLPGAPACGGPIDVLALRTARSRVLSRTQARNFTIR